ncbi:MAG: DUF4148 domain-containing protein [Rubrivivax sp.]|nr:DUF4148 domain-containing protein [Rubrivivax sp.]
MNAKQIIAITTLAFAGGAAMADDITIVEDNFVATQTRAAVLAEVRQARAAGDVFVSEVDLSTTQSPAQASTLTRAEVQAELRNSPRQTVMQYNPAA